MLYLVATPIGNLSDITFRAVETLKSCDYILCEDTRTSLTLFKKYNIQKPIYSYHKFSNSKRTENIISDLEEGKNISLVSDAGTPSICDPGFELVTLCKQKNIPITLIPGPCALIMALVLSGFSSKQFQFLGFLDKKPSSQLNQMLLYEGTSIAYETALRIEKTLDLIAKKEPNRKLCIARELTKTFEETLNGTAEELLLIFKSKPPRGELILLVEDLNQETLFAKMGEKECFEYLQKVYGLNTCEAIKITAQLQNKPKNKVYKTIHNL